MAKERYTFYDDGSKQGKQIKKILDDNEINYEYFFRPKYKTTRVYDNESGYVYTKKDVAELEEKIRE